MFEVIFHTQTLAKLLIAVLLRCLVYKPTVCGGLTGKQKDIK